jgi:predicted flap endonuclease-1-like 5' DNA nuclease
MTTSAFSFAVVERGLASPAHLGDLAHHPAPATTHGDADLGLTRISPQALHRLADHGIATVGQVAAMTYEDTQKLGWTPATLHGLFHRLGIQLPCRVDDGWTRVPPRVRRRLAEHGVTTRAQVATMTYEDVQRLELTLPAVRNLFRHLGVSEPCRPDDGLTGVSTRARRRLAKRGVTTAAQVATMAFWEVQRLRWTPQTVNNLFRRLGIVAPRRPVDRKQGRRIW